MSAIPTYSETLIVNRRFSAAEIEEINARIMKETDAPVVNLNFQGAHPGSKLPAVFARVRDLSGGGTRYILKAGPHLICVTQDKTHVVMHGKFNMEEYFGRLQRGEPCGAIQEGIEGPKTTLLPYVYTNLATYIYDCCLALCYGNKRASTVALTKGAS